MSVLGEQFVAGDMATGEMKIRFLIRIVARTGAAAPGRRRAVIESL